MRRYILIIGIALSLMAGRPPVKEAAKKEMEKVQGTWKIVSMEVGGKPLFDQATLKGATLTFKDNQVVRNIPEANQKDLGALYTLDPSRKPAAIDILTPQNESLPGIYQLENDHLKICIDESGKKRPATFATRPDTELILYVLQRKKA